jgi:hypothetical protein
MRQTLRDYGYKLSKVPLLCDNESAIRMADSSIEHSRTKHIDIRYHFLRDHQQRGDIEIAYVSTKEQLAYIFTKPLDEKTFTKLRNELSILDSQNFDWNIAHIAHLYTFDHISFMTMTNMFFKYISILSHRLKGKWSLRRRQGFHSTLSVSFTLRHHSTSFSLWYNLSLIFTCTNGGESKKSSQKTPFLEINAKGGEIISPKQKDRTTTLRKFLIDIFQNLVWFQLISIFFKLVTKCIWSLSIGIHKNW